MLIINAKIHIGDGTVLQNGWLSFENGKITGLGEHSCPINEREIIDARGRDVTPGLIDAHCHIGIIEDSMRWEGDDANELGDPITPHLRAIDAVNARDRAFSDALSAGITTVMTGPGSANPIAGQLLVMKTLGTRVDDMLISPAAAMKFSMGENPKDVYGRNDKPPFTRMGIAAAIRDALFSAKDYTASRERAAAKDDAPPDFNLKWDSLAPVLKRELPAHFHAHRSDDIFTAMRIAREFDLDFVIVHGTDSACIADELANENVKIITGPLLSERCKVELKSLSFELPEMLRRTGLRPAICTDAPVIPIEYLPVCAGLAAKAGMPAEEAIAAITGNAAAILGLDSRIGYLRAGLDADIVLWNNHPLSLEAAPSDVWLNGIKCRGDN